MKWIMQEHRPWLLAAFFGTMMLLAPVGRLPRRQDRRAVVILAVAVLVFAEAWPLFSPWLARSALRQITTRLDSNGVCLQSTDYTCGPASAVTALRRLGLPAEESELALLAETSSFTGTDPSILASRLQQLYGPQGLHCEYRYFRSAQELPTGAFLLAVVKFGFLVDHYVTVLASDASSVTIGDPLNGLQRLTPAEFGRRWRQVGVVVWREPGPTARQH